MQTYDNNANVIESTNPAIAPDGSFSAAGATKRGTSSGRVSSEWFSRPDDERFLSLDELYDHTKKCASESFAVNVDVRGIRVDASPENPDRMTFEIPTVGNHSPHFAPESAVITQPNHWSFGQVCSLVQVPAGYMRKLPATIAAINVQYALANFRQELVKAYVRENGRTELRACTGPAYGRIYDHEVVNAVRRIAGNGTGDTHWKVPGMMDWSTMRYNPHVDITKETTTLFASDRDCFMFLVDDTHPIEIGKLPNGDPDLVFRGFYAWNSETGSKTFGLAAFYLRGVCQNRCLWGIEGFREVTFRHSSGAPSRFAHEIRPALESFANGRTDRLMLGVQAAKTQRIATDDDGAREWLGRNKFTQPEISRILKTHMEEEGRPVRSVWDVVQGITAAARGIKHTDERIDMEKRAGRILDKVKP